MPARPLAWCLLLWVIASSARADETVPAGTMTLDRAVVEATVGGWPQPVGEMQLPLHWDVIYRGRSGTARLTLSFRGPTSYADEPFMLFSPRIANAYSIELNGT